ncbi:hypothetical protein [Streptomyces sp. NBC_01217]|uniref:hypothetical protein n=1 Tax=Streptomyces sp. NBC_01217 TaxID=2903779 RepID=UPI002E11DC43|nr:hypothetical protein OG507_32410 [Streptomyces sp. NBC_01217]
MNTLGVLYGLSVVEGLARIPRRCWSATTGQHVAFESWPARDSLLHGLDPAVVWIASQLFWPLARRFA